MASLAESFYSSQSGAGCHLFNQLLSAFKHFLIKFDPALVGTKTCNLANHLQIKLVNSPVVVSLLFYLIFKMSMCGCLHVIPFRVAVNQPSNQQTLDKVYNLPSNQMYTTGQKF